MSQRILTTIHTVTRLTVFVCWVLFNTIHEAQVKKIKRNCYTNIKARYSKKKKSINISKLLTLYLNSFHSCIHGGIKFSLKQLINTAPTPHAHTTKREWRSLALLHLLQASFLCLFQETGPATVRVPKRKPAVSKRKPVRISNWQHLSFLERSDYMTHTYLYTVFVHIN
jgi:hypothetical protein